MPQRPVPPTPGKTSVRLPRRPAWHDLPARPGPATASPMPLNAAALELPVETGSLKR